MGFAWIASKPTVLQNTAIALRRWVGYGRIPREVSINGGRFATLTDVVNHYNSCFSLGFGDQDKADVVEYLKSIPGARAD